MEKLSTYKPSWATADGDAVVKFKGDGVENARVSNVGKAIEVLRGGKAAHLVGRRLNSLTQQEMQLLRANNATKLHYVNHAWEFKWDTEGSALFSAIGKRIPGMNSLSVFHDVWMAKQNVQSSLVLATTIAPAMVINYQAIGVGYYDYLYDSLQK